MELKDLTKKSLNLGFHGLIQKSIDFINKYYKYLMHRLNRGFKIQI
jgi:hypothetical protein